MKIINIAEIDDNLSKLTFGVQVKIWWDEPRIRISKKMLFLNHDFSRNCIWSPRLLFRNQISTKKQELIQNDFNLKITNETNKVATSTLL